MTTREIGRRLGLALGLGKLRIVDDTGPVQQAQVQFSAAEARMVPVLYFFGFSANPPAGVDVAFKCLDGDRSKAVVVGTGHKGSRPRSLPSGATVVFDLGGSQVLLNNDGTIALKPSNGIVNVIGAVNATGEITALSGGEGAVRLGDHTHGGVQTGGGHTAVPDPGS